MGGYLVIIADQTLVDSFQYQVPVKKSTLEAHRRQALLSIEPHQGWRIFRGIKVAHWLNQPQVEVAVWLCWLLQIFLVLCIQCCCGPFLYLSVLAPHASCFTQILRVFQIENHNELQYCSLSNVGESPAFELLQQLHHCLLGFHMTSDVHNQTFNLNPYDLLWVIEFKDEVVHQLLQIDSSSDVY